MSPTRHEPITHTKRTHRSGAPVVWQAHLVVDGAQDGLATSHLGGGYGVTPRVRIAEHDVAVVAVGVEHPQVQDGDAMHLGGG